MPKVKSNFVPGGQEESERTTRLLDVAADVFLESGYENASTTDIAMRAHASKQTLYALYPSKEKLFLAVLARMMDQTFRALQTPLRREASLRETLLSLGSAILSVLQTPRQFALVRIVYLESQRFPDVRKSFYDLGPGRALQQIEAYMTEQKRQGTLHFPSPRLAAEQFLDLIIGGTLLRHALLDLGDSPLSSPVQQRRRVQAAVDLFLDGYGR